MNGDTCPPDERERVAAVLSGDASAIDSWYRAHRRDVYRLCLGFLADAAEAEDACHDVLLHLMDSLSAWTPSARFTPWRNTVVLNWCRDRRRRGQRRQEAEAEAASRRPEDSGWTPEVALQADEVRHVLQEALRSLTDREREAFVLRDLEGLSTPEASQVMGVAEGTVRSLTTLARRRLRGLLARTLGLDPETGETLEEVGHG